MAKPTNEVCFRHACWVTGGYWAEFKQDLGTSFQAWRDRPLLPVISVLFFLASYIKVGPLSLVLLPVGLFSVGWPGTERIWYLRIYRGTSISLRELNRITWAFFWRFIRLGLLASLVWSPVFIILFRSRAGQTGSPETLPGAPILISMIVLIVLIDVLLTFVTPALAYTTRRVREALRIGIRMLRDEWPRSAWYALIPPLAVVLTMRMWDPISPNRVLVGGLSVVSTLLNLWFKGATAAFYLRRFDVDDNGAAFLSKRSLTRDLQSIWNQPRV